MSAIRRLIVRATSALLVLLLTVGYPGSMSTAKTNVQRVKVLGRGTVNDIALSPDGKTLAVDGSAGTWLYKVAALDETPRLLVPSASGADPNQRPWDAPPPPTPCPQDAPCGGGGGRGGGGGEAPPTGFGSHIAFSPDSSKLLIPGDNKDGLWLWDLNKEQGQHILENTTYGAFTPDGSMIIGTDGWWDVASHQKRANLPGLNLYMDTIDFSPDGKMAVLSVFPTESLLDIATRSQRPLPGEAAFSPDSRLLAYRSSESVDIIEVSGGKQILSLPGDILDRPAFSPDGTLLAVGVWNDIQGKPAVQVWDITTKTLRTELVAPDESLGIENQQFAPDGHTLAVSYWASVSAGAGRSPEMPIALWDVATGKLKATLVNDNGQLNTRIDYTAQGIALTVDATSVIRLWNMTTGKLLGKITGYSGGSVETVAYTPQDKLLEVTNDTYTRTLSVLDPQTGSSTVITAALFGDYTVSPDGSMFTALDFDHNHLVLWHTFPKIETIPLLDSTTFKPDATTPNGQVIPPLAVFSPDSQWLAVSSPPGIHLFETKKGTDQALLALPNRDVLGVPVPGDPVLGLRFSPDSKLLAVRASSGAELWDLAARRVILTAAFSNAQTMTFSPDSALFALAGTAATVSIWETATGSLHNYETPCPVLEMTFVPKGDVLILACNDGKISSVSVSSPTVQPSAGVFNQFTASQDGDLFVFIFPGTVFSYTDDKGKPILWYPDFCIWDSATRQPIPGTTGDSFAFSRDGRHFAVGTGGLIEVWTAGTQ